MSVHMSATVCTHLHMSILMSIRTYVYMQRHLQSTSFVRSCDGRYATPCNVNMLYSHDTGDLLADIQFITEMASSGGHSFVGAFNTSVTTAYCVRRKKETYADYLSCNGPDTEHYTCHLAVPQSWNKNCGLSKSQFLFLPFMGQKVVFWVRKRCFVVFWTECQV